MKWHENIALLILVALPMGSAGSAFFGKLGKLADEVSPKMKQKIMGYISAGKNSKAAENTKVLVLPANVATKEGIAAIKKSETAKKAVLEMMDDFGASVGKGGKAFSAADEPARRKFIETAGMFVLKSNGKVDWVKISSLVVATGTVVSVEGLTVASWLLDRTMSIAAKFEPQPNKMVLKLPFFPVQNLGLGPDMMYKISVLDKPKMFDSTAYLASPCKANFEVEMDKCYCEKSSYRVVDKGEVWDGYEKKLYDLEDNSDTAIDETKDLDGMVSCDLVTQGHNMALFAEGVIPKSLEVLRTSQPKELLKNIMELKDAKKAFYSYHRELYDASEDLMNLWTVDEIFEVDCAKIKDTWHEDSSSDTNFCYASASGVGTTVIAITFIADVAIMIMSRGWLAEAAVGVAGFGLSYYATHSTSWPGHNSLYWNS